MSRTLSVVRRLKFQEAVAAIQAHSVEKGLDKMTDEEIEAEIAAARK